MSNKYDLCKPLKSPWSYEKLEEEFSKLPEEFQKENPIKKQNGDYKKLADYLRILGANQGVVINGGPNPANGDTHFKNTLEKMGINADKLQLRHLRDTGSGNGSGWDMQHGNKDKLPPDNAIFWFRPNNNWKPRNNNKVNNDEWKELLRKYDYSCSVCRVKEKDINKKLEKGHLNPSLDLTVDNCAPMCYKCNHLAKNRICFKKDIRMDGKPMIRMDTDARNIQ